MTDPSLKRLRIGLVILATIIVVAVAGYMIAGWGLVDSIYMVAMVLSTVGLGDAHQSTLSPALKIFTSLVMVVGVAAALYIVGGLAQMMAEGEIRRALGLRRVDQEIERLSGHVIICGFGRMGEIIAQEIHRQKLPLVVVEKDAERLAEAASQKYLALGDDATEEEALVHAGVGRAKTLVTTLPNDAGNVFITLTARNLNARLMIIARGEFRTTEKKLLQAGADRIVMPAAAGAMRMAAMITRPSAVELIEVVSGRQISEVEVDELVVSDASPLVGRTIRDAEPRTRHGLMVVGMRRSGGTLQLNPGGDAQFEPGASVIVMGRPEDIDRFRAEYKI